MELEVMEDQAVALTSQFVKTGPAPLLTAAICFVGFFAASILIKKALTPFCLKLAQKKQKEWLCILLRSFSTPLSLALAVTGVGLAVFCLQLSWLNEAWFRTLLQKFLSLFWIGAFAWGGFSACDIVPPMFDGISLRNKRPVTQGLTLFVQRIAQAIVVALAAVMMLSELGYNVNGLVAGLGLGGLTVALAAKDAASNFFGGFTIITERPFDIGDWITAGGLEGSVEDITLRSTKLRTVENALTVVPNSILCAGAITNWTRMQMRLARMTVGVMYSTPQATIAHVIDDIRAMLQTHDEVVSDTVQVQLSDFGASSIDIFIQYYTIPTQIAEHRRVKADVNYKIMQIMTNNSAAFAFPSQSLYVESMPIPKERIL